MRRVYAYLINRRGIDRDVIYTFAHCGLIYESEKYHNVVFVGKDNQGIPRHIHKRGTASESTYKGNADSSIPEFSFHWNGKSDKIYLFEAPIDMLSLLRCIRKIGSSIRMQPVAVYPTECFFKCLTITRI